MCVCVCGGGGHVPCTVGPLAASPAPARYTQHQHLSFPVLKTTEVSIAKGPQWGKEGTKITFHWEHHTTPITLFYGEMTFYYI